MRMTKLLVLLAIFLLAAAPAAAEEPSTKPEATGPEASKPESTPVFYFRDQSKVTGNPEFEKLEVKTSYGALSIPREQLIQVRFALRIPGDVRAQIPKLMEELGSEDFDTREKATDALKAIGSPALEAAQKGAKSENEEVKLRCQTILSTEGQCGMR